MAKAKMCDKCGGFFEWNLRRTDISPEYCSPTNKTLRGYAADGDYIPSIVKVCMAYLNVRDDETVCASETFDLCPSCMAKVLNFIKGGTYNEND